MMLEADRPSPTHISSCLENKHWPDDRQTHYDLVLGTYSCWTVRQEKWKPLAMTETKKHMFITMSRRAIVDADLGAYDDTIKIMKPSKWLNISTLPVIYVLPSTFINMIYIYIRISLCICPYDV